jgi:hypothetical protein
MNLLTVLAVILLIIMIIAPFILLRRRKARQQPPTPIRAEFVDFIEANYAHAHGLTLDVWQSLPPATRAQLRDNVAHGVNRRPTTSMPCRCSKCMQALIAYKRSS